ncbi:MAG: HAMP domain-containing sensor histidine kinase [Hyphomicrobium sp.]
MPPTLPEPQAPLTLSSARHALKEKLGLPWRVPGNFQHSWSGLKLPAKLLLLTALFVMLIEILIFLPSISAFRIGWLNDRLNASYVAMLAADASPGHSVPPALRNELLRNGLIRAIAARRGGARHLILPPVSALEISASYDLRDDPSLSLGQATGVWLGRIRDALEVFIASDDRTLRVTGLLGPRFDDVLEIVLPEEQLKKAMVKHALNIIWLSVIISLTTAALVYFALNRLLVQPMMRLSRNMLQFSESPEDPSRIIVPSERGDEIGTAERELAHMQRQLAQALTEKNRLAQLGLAVAKISHDLRNMLANAQLISDRLTALPDPTVQQFAPKLIASLDRAINFCTDSLKFGRTEEMHPRRDLMRLKPVVEEAGEGLGLPREPSSTQGSATGHLARDVPIGWDVEMDETLMVDADHEHLFRVLSNLVRNAVQAIEHQGAGTKGLIKVKAQREGRKVAIEISDNGPGIPEHQRTNLFKAFQGSTKKGGTGLGLVIAAELIAAHGGTLRLADTPTGATFRIELPDRVV